MERAATDSDPHLTNTASRATLKGLHPMTDRLDHAIINVINSYRNIGGRRVTADNLPHRFITLYTAIEALANEYTHNHTPTPLTNPPCGENICHCNHYQHPHFHQNDCTCWNDYALPTT
jgi:hypothetical protein